MGIQNLLFQTPFSCHINNNKNHIGQCKVKEPPWKSWLPIVALQALDSPLKFCRQTPCSHFTKPKGHGFEKGQIVQKQQKIKLQNLWQSVSQWIFSIIFILKNCIEKREQKLLPLISVLMISASQIQKYNVIQANTNRALLQHSCRMHREWGQKGNHAICTELFSTQLPT